MTTKPVKWTDEQLAFIKIAAKTYGDNAILVQEDIKTLSQTPGIVYPYWLVKSTYAVERNKYQVPSMADVGLEYEDTTEESSDNVTADDNLLDGLVDDDISKVLDASMNFVPKKIVGYVPFGFFDDVKTIIASEMFMPVFVSSLSGTGKTTMVEHACALANRELVIVNISIETDQSDLIGGPTLLNGNVVNRDGPVLIAMRRGAVLLLDEVDRGSTKLLCLQTILEGKPYLNKQTSEVIYPAKGFNVIATANTKGKGSEDGRYLSNILDDAFLERFPITIEHDFANTATEKKILLNALKISGMQDDAFADILMSWSSKIRKAANSGALDDIISTRRLCHIVHVYGIFKERKKAVEYCINRFDDASKKSFIEFYNMLELKS